MSTALKVSGIIVVVYIVFIFLPAVVMYLAVFYKRNEKKVREQPLNEDCYHFFKQQTCQQLKVENDGLLLEGNYYDRNSNKTVILVHGFSAIGESFLGRYGKEFYDKGYNLLFIKQRAHRNSQGNFSTMGILEAKDLIKWAEYVSIFSEQIIIVGQSMGGYTIALAASQLNQKVKMLIIDCGYQSVISQLTHEAKIRNLPSQLLMPVIKILARIISGIDLNSNCIDSLRQNRIPTIFIQSKKDPVVLYQQSFKNFSINASDKLLILVQQGAHCQAINFIGDKQRKKMDNFISKYVE